MQLTPAAPQTLAHDDIARRIPHQGSMCLLEQVTEWDNTRLSCTAASHRAASNPLRANGQLGAACAIEYAAQAMAIHGALIAEAAAHAAGAISKAPAAGYLVSVRGVQLQVERLDDLSDVLTIHAERISGDSHTILYGFTVLAALVPIASGRAVVMLDAAPAAPAR
jgi:predicted hotdog family 3-hydroxylacyl-ACP dehydratase